MTSKDYETKLKAQSRARPPRKESRLVNYSNQQLVDIGAVKIVDPAKAKRWLDGEFEIQSKQ